MRERRTSREGSSNVEEPSPVGRRIVPHARGRLESCLDTSKKEELKENHGFVAQNNSTGRLEVDAV